MFIFENKKYDLTEFAALHPGGKDYITMMEGIDGTHVLKVIHPDVKVIRRVIAKYKIGECEKRRVPTTKKYLGLFNELNALVPKGRENHKWPLYAFIPYLLTYIYLIVWCFDLLHESTLNPFYIILTSLVYVPFASRIFHEASHNTLPITKYFNFNKLYSVVTLGMLNQFSWTLQHIILHHAETNDPNVDLDGDTGKLSQYYERLLTGYKMSYGLFFANLFSVFKVSVKTPKSAWGYVALQAFMYYCLAQYIGWLNLIAFTGVSGVFFTLSATLSHSQPELIKITEGYSSCPDEWAANQFLTTCNYGVKKYRNPYATILESFVVWHFSYGLCNQIEHHVIPYVSHYYYWDIAPKVEAIAKKYDLPYHSKHIKKACVDYHRTLS